MKLWEGVWNQGYLWWGTLLNIAWKFHFFNNIYIIIKTMQFFGYLVVSLGLTVTLPVGDLQKIGLRQQKLRITSRQKVWPSTHLLLGRSFDTQPNGNLNHVTRSQGLLCPFQFHPWIQLPQTTMSVTQLQLGFKPQLPSLLAASLAQ
jgi:hypothetical protein